ncbi:hypothetical protein EG68_11516 [Paragonimus skrjabini miyazakii]|uniref:Uncharacterized protein n=1 Tax=Paragonimus skrjabini miyazakii TaxID=59628 RepID=A0A8S9YQ89_9TREM|nr:hypothetical protein EG68_11516 [Paragonimus skrjabini miyazakii]
MLCRYVFPLSGYRVSGRQLSEPAMSAWFFLLPCLVSNHVSFVGRHYARLIWIRVLPDLIFFSLFTSTVLVLSPASWFLFHSVRAFFFIFVLSVGYLCSSFLLHTGQLLSGNVELILYAYLSCS